MPTISNATLLWIIREQTSKSIITTIAPRKAPEIMARKPFTDKSSVVRLPLNTRITIATPRLAPLFIPNMDGPARGLQNAVCSINPQIASDAPQSNAVTACGKRDSNTMYLHTGLTLSPNRIPVTSLHGICTDPSVILRIKDMIIAEQMRIIVKLRLLPLMNSKLIIDIILIS